MTTIDSITLSEPLLWLNRNNTPRVAANMKRALNGAPLVQQTAIQAGITMELGTQNGWLSRSEFEQLQTHAATMLTNFTLQYEGTSYNVIWDNTAGAAVGGVDLFDQVGGFDQLTNVVLKFLIL
jgi:hypothetical protein